MMDNSPQSVANPDTLESANLPINPKFGKSRFLE